MSKNTAKLYLGLAGVGSALAGVSLFGGSVAHAQTAVTWDTSSTDAIVQPTWTQFKLMIIYLWSNFGPVIIGITAAIAAVTIILVLLFRHKRLKG